MATSDSTMAVAAVAAATGAVVGAGAAVLCSGGLPSARRLPRASQCPRGGVLTFESNATPLCKSETWVFLWNHFADLEYFNEHVFNGVVRTIGLKGVTRPSISYPVRLKKEAGFRREWGHRGGAGAEAIGDQTVTRLCRGGTDKPAHDMVGVLVCLQSMHSTAPKTGMKAHWLQDRMQPGSRTAANVKACVEDVDAAQFEWLAPMDNHSLLQPGATVCVMYFDTATCAPTNDGGVFSDDGSKLPIAMAPAPASARLHLGPPDQSCPILQSQVDTLMKAALPYGEDFAAEWLTSIHEWSACWLNDREHPRRPWLHTPNALQIDRLLKLHVPSFVSRVYECDFHFCHLDATAAVKSEISVPRAVRLVSINFLIGFGSIINTKSRAASDPAAVDAAPCRVSAKFGYVREWNFQASTAQICALGLRQCAAGEQGASINGIICSAPDDMTAFDARENGYRRVQVPSHMVTMLSWQRLPRDAVIWIYVPYSPAVVTKFGTDSKSGLPLCSGPTTPEGLDERTEAAGLGLHPPSPKYPILQSYVDVCLSGCLEHGDDFAREFIETTFLW